MYKYLAIFLIFLANGSAYSQEASAPEYRDEDFIEFIQSSLARAIGEEWDVAYMEGQIEVAESGDFEVQASYYYSPRSPYDDVRLFLSNTTALHNAMAYINKNAEDRGEEWSSFKLEFFPDETHKLTTW